jgi:hypothetical protein
MRVAKIGLLAVLILGSLARKILPAKKAILL